MIKPKKLRQGDKVATISLSWGGAGELPDRYQAGKQQLEETFGITVVETKNALQSAEWIYKNPKARAEDLMEAFADKSIKAIISNIGGEDSIRILPFIDLDVIRQNPKIFMGFSDTTVTHLCCYKAGLTSFYGTSLLVGFAENGGMHQYQVDDIKRTLFSSSVIGQIPENKEGWTSEHLDWSDPANQNIKRKLNPAAEWRRLQGEGIVEGKLIGGCVEVLEFLKETDFWFTTSDWEDSILFLETSEEMMEPKHFRWILRNYAAGGVLKKINGLILARPYDNKYADEYDSILLQIIRDEEGLSKLPIFTGLDFGHTCPTFTLPYGMKAKLNCSDITLEICESGTEE